MENPYLSLLGIAWKYARNERRKYILIYCMLILANATIACEPILFGWFIGKAQLDSSHIKHYILVFVGVYMLLKLFQKCMHGPARFMERKLAFNLSQNFLMTRYHQALHLPLKWHQDHHSGSTINRIRKAYEALKSFFENGFLYLQAICRMSFSIIAMLYFSVPFGVIGIVLGLITVRVIFKFDKPYIRSMQEVNEKDHIISSTLFDSLSNIMTIVTLRLEKSMEDGLLKKIQAMFIPFKKNVVIDEWKWITADILITIIYIIIAIGYIYQNSVSGVPFKIGGFVTLMGFVGQFTSVFNDVAWHYTSIVQNNTAVQTAQVIEDAFLSQHRPDKFKAISYDWKFINFNSLNFSYLNEYQKTHTPQSLHDINLKLEKGKKIALVGESGSGKSTLLALLRGLYTPQPGFVIKVDNDECDFSAINMAVTLFPQDPEIFENSILFNMTLGLPFSDKDITNASECSKFDIVLKELPLGLESDIREKGVNLSGGQKQRLALARGVLASRDSEIILLDEPTSSIDSQTEELIYRNLFNCFKDKVIISSIHRLHLLHRFDYIYILKQGSIVDEGTFSYLSNQSEIFKNLYKYNEDAHNPSN